MKPLSLLQAGLCAALAALPCHGQLILKQDGVQTFPSFYPSLGSEWQLWSSTGSHTTWNGATLVADFSFDASLGQLDLTLTNVSNLPATANISQFGFNSPAAWGTLSSYTIVPLNGGDPDMVGPGKISNKDFNILIGVGEQGSGSGDQPGELGLDQGESVNINLWFSVLNAPNFSLTGILLRDNLLSSPDIGVRIQPLSYNGFEATSDKWILYYNGSGEVPPPPPPPIAVPEPTTYGLAGLAMMGALAGLRSWRRRR